MASRSKTRQKSPPKPTPNEQILEKMRENASEVVDEFDDVLEA